MKVPREIEEEIERLKRELHVSKEQLSLVLEAVGEEVYFTDAEGRYVFANGAALKEFGHRSVESVEVRKIISHMIVLRADGTVRPMEEAPPLRALAGEVVRDEEQILHTPRAGEPRRRRVSAAPVHDPQGKIVGSVAIVRDVTERWRSETARRSSAAARSGGQESASGPSAARNIEVKARVASLAEVETRARTLADQGPIDLTQDDTFFACAGGRLKLRQLAPDRGEIIFYKRPDVPGPKLCEYTRVATPAPALLRSLLGDALGIIGRVRKRRRLYLAGATRIHLDEVEGLGSYLELEVVLGEGQSAAEGEAVARRLVAQLGVEPAQLVSGAYLDLLQGRTAAP
ncbi:MAG: CYTH domain-containing protein [Steroidobacteraceae bacterium]